MFRSILVLVGGLASLSTVSLFAQEAVLGQEYGSGVHAYFAGDFFKAHEKLTSAIDGGTKDPRAFYFRGLACLRLGRPQDATIDFRKGAELESKDVNQFYNVGRALERVQGSARAELENYRVEARMAAYEATERIRKARYEAIRREEERVLRAQAVAAPEADETVEVIEPEATADDAAFDPFAVPVKKADEPAEEPAEADADAPVEKPAEVVEPPKKPVDKAPPAEEEGDDPFAEPAKPAAEKMPDADEKPAADAEGKKGGLLGAMGKAMGNAIGNADKKPAPDKKPAEAEGDDPFSAPAGADEKAPAAEEKAPAAKEKAAEEADPFA